MPSWRGAQLKHNNNFIFYLEIVSKIKFVVLAEAWCVLRAVRWYHTSVWQSLGTYVCNMLAVEDLFMSKHFNYVQVQSKYKGVLNVLGK